MGQGRHFVGPALAFQDKFVGYAIAYQYEGESNFYGTVAAMHLTNDNYLEDHKFGLTASGGKRFSPGKLSFGFHSGLIVFFGNPKPIYSDITGIFLAYNFDGLEVRLQGSVLSANNTSTMFSLSFLHEF